MVMALSCNREDRHAERPYLTIHRGAACETAPQDAPGTTIGDRRECGAGRI